MVRSNSPVERPTTAPPRERTIAWGSDALAELLSRLELPFISLNPGASYRGLHDSLVNYLGNEQPTVVVALHEEHAVAIAHGYAKVTEEPLAVALHANVGLMHATMALFNAFCDRVPMLVLGATGPVDAARRRPWIDWIHTAADQGALIRGFVKWDDQPASVPAALDSLVRANLVTRSYPCAPAYVCLDAALQEAPLASPPPFPDLSRHRPPAWPGADEASLAAVAELLGRAERPLILAGRVGRGERGWAARIELAERLEAGVLTDLKVAAAFPTEHRLHPARPGTFLPPDGAALMRAADVVLALDWVDLGGTLAQAFGDERVAPQVISVSGDAALHNGWSKDHFALAPVDLAVTAHPDPLVEALLDRLPRRPPTPGWPPPPFAAGEPDRDGEITVAGLAAALRDALAGRQSCLVRAPLGWSGDDWSIGGPLDYLGQDGGAGLASGPGMAVGAALALRDSGRLAVAVLGDGDFLMGASALWSAARYRLPVLVVVANNRTFLNDEIHQERVARARERPVENRWVGQQIRDPDPDLAALGRSLGLRGIGPIADHAALAGALAQAVEATASGEAVVVDVRVQGSDYPGVRPGKESER
jgi:thiamine pyrophosphate-dependent acetolactate synthase large subunit-like protein